MARDGEQLLPEAGRLRGPGCEPGAPLTAWVDFVPASPCLHVLIRVMGPSPMVVTTE